MGGARLLILAQILILPLYGHDIVVGSDGTIYILYDDCWGPECSITELVLKKSTDGGITWTERQVISDGLGTYWS
jgi:hypothetical protein